MTDLQKHQVNIQGREYFTVAGRVKLFRGEYPDGRIITELLQVDDNHCLARATIVQPDGAVLATGHAMTRASESSRFAGRYIEKAETSAVGRALGMAGYGELVDEDELDRDSLRKQLHAVGKAVYGDEWDEKRHELVSKLTGGKSTSSKNLSADQLDRLVAGLLEHQRRIDADAAKETLTGDGNGERRL